MTDSPYRFLAWLADPVTACRIVNFQGTAKLEADHRQGRQVDYAGFQTILQNHILTSMVQTTYTLSISFNS